MASDTTAPILTRLSPELLNMVFRHVVRGEKAVICATKRNRRDNFKSPHEFCCVNDYFAIFGPSSGVSEPYRKALGDYLVAEAVDVVANVRDLDFTGLKAFLATASQWEVLAPFQEDVEGQPSIGWRNLQVNHIITRKCPDTIEKLERFSSFVTATEKRHSLERRVVVNHQMAECENIARLATLQDSLPRFGIGTESNVKEEACKMFWDVRTADFNRKLTNAYEWEEYREKVHVSLGDGSDPGSPPSFHDDVSLDAVDYDDDDDDDDVTLQ